MSSFERIDFFKKLVKVFSYFCPYYFFLIKSWFCYSFLYAANLLSSSSEFSVRPLKHRLRIRWSIRLVILGNGFSIRPNLFRYSYDFRMASNHSSFSVLCCTQASKLIFMRIFIIKKLKNIFCIITFVGTRFFIIFCLLRDSSEFLIPL